MKKQIILSLILGIFILNGIMSINASLGSFKQGNCISIITSLNTSSVNISVITSPSGNILETNKIMTKIGNSFNYTFCITDEIGTYTYGYCDIEGNCYGNDFEITIAGSNDNNFTTGAFFIGLGLLVSIFLYLKVSKFFGSMLIFITGLGVLFSSPNTGWIGYIIMSSGFLMIVYSLIEPGKRRNRRGF